MDTFIVSVSLKVQADNEEDAVELVQAALANLQERELSMHDNVVLGDYWVRSVHRG